MAINAQAADGSVHSFPDGTDPGVIDRVMKAYAQAPKPDSTLGDVAKSFATGVKQGFSSAADQVTPFLLPGLSTIRQAANMADTVMHGRPNTPTLANNIFQNTASAVVPDHTPQTTAGQYARTVGQFTPAALMPGSLPARAANVVIPALASEAAGQMAHAAGAPGWAEQAARVAGGLGGGALASARLTPREQPSPDAVVANIYAKRAGADPAEMAQQAAEMRATGVDPTLVDLTGTPGQRLTKAVGITNEQAGETLQNNARTASATTKPAVMARTRGLTSDARTAEQLASDLAKARSEEAATTYAAPYAAKVDLTDRNVIQALRDPEGAGAINRAITAARARMDYAAEADLKALKETAAGPTGDGQVWPTTGRALDRVQIAFGNKAQALAQNGSNDIASGLRMRQDRINGLLDTVEGLQPARAAYRAKSQALDVLSGKAKLDAFTTDPRDYADWLKGLSPEARQANQVAIRQDILDALGGQRASSFGTIDNLASSAYAEPNLKAALGEQKAANYIAGLNARLRQTRNATQVSPYAGSPTKMLQADTAGLDRAVDIADTAVKVKTGNVIGLTAKLATYLKTRGLSDQQAQEFAQASVDPSRVNGVIAELQRLKGPQEVRSFINFRGGLLGVARGSYRASQPTQQPALQ